MTHSPTPWRVDDNGDVKSADDRMIVWSHPDDDCWHRCDEMCKRMHVIEDADAQHIVLAVNAFDSLCAACQYLHILTNGLIDNATQYTEDQLKIICAMNQMAFGLLERCKPSLLTSEAPTVLPSLTAQSTKSASRTS